MEGRSKQRRKCVFNPPIVQCLRIVTALKGKPESNAALSRYVCLHVLGILGFLVYFLPPGNAGEVYVGRSIDMPISHCSAPTHPSHSWKLLYPQKSPAWSRRLPTLLVVMEATAGPRLGAGISKSARLYKRLFGCVSFIYFGLEDGFLLLFPFSLTTVFTHYFKITEK